MTVGAAQMFDTAWLNILNGTIDLDGDSFRWVLVTSSYTPDNTHSAWSSISTNEVANGSGYTTHGKTATFTVSLSTGTVTIDANEPSWTSSSITAKYAMIIRDADGNGSLASTDLPIMYVDLKTEGGSESSVSDTFSVTTPSALFTSVAPNS